MALLAAMVGFCHLVAGFSNRQMVGRVRALGQHPTAHVRRRMIRADAKRKGLIVKLAHPHRYQLTGPGRRVAVLVAKVHGRVLAPGLSAPDPRLPEDVTARGAIARAWCSFEQMLDDYIQAQLIAA